MMNFANKAVLILKRIGDWLDRSQTGIALLPLLGLGLSIICEKIVVSLFTAAIRFRFYGMSASDPEMAHKMSFWEGMSLVRADMLLSFLVIPLIFCVLTSWLAPRWRIVIAACFAALVQFVVLLEMACYILVRATDSLQMGWFVLQWFIKTHQLAVNQFTHIARGTHRVLPAAAAADLLSIVLTAVLALIAAKRRWQWLNKATLVAFATMAALGAIAYVPNVRTTAWSQPLLKVFVLPAFTPAYGSYRSDGRSVAELLRAYREAAHSPAPSDTAFTGAAKNYNVVFFVMESISADAFDPARESLDDMPNVKELRQQSFVMPSHFTTVPITNHVIFSMFTSQYFVGGASVAYHETELPGVLRTLGNQGYATAFYGFVWHDEMGNDLPLIKSVGFQKVVSPPSGDMASAKTFAGALDYVEKYDHSALLSMKADIRNWAAHGQRFATCFFPEIGHDPYRALTPGSQKPILERGHDLVVYQDAWLGELLDELKRDGVLDHTIIVFTSDHGLRMVQPPRADSPFSTFTVSSSTLNDTMLRVPMLIYVPGVLKQPTYENTPTSHIDVAPTVLDLLGNSAGREMEEGLPVYDPGTANRRLFLQMPLWGASGFHFAGKYYSRSAIGNVYASPTMQFSADDLTPYDSADAINVRKIIEAQELNQSTLADRLLDSR